jgi:hypothetical protein
MLHIYICVYLQVNMYYTCVCNVCMYICMHSKETDSGSVGSSTLGSSKMTKKSDFEILQNNPFFKTGLKNPFFDTVEPTKTAFPPEVLVTLTAGCMWGNEGDKSIVPSMYVPDYRSATRASALKEFNRKGVHSKHTYIHTYINTYIYCH